MYIGYTRSDIHVHQPEMIQNMYFFNYDEPLFRPPSEAQSLILQITIGCSHNGCHFCSMYKTKQFRLRPLTEIFAEIESIPLRFRSSVRRIFLADGDALIYPHLELLMILRKLNETFVQLQRVTSYASPNSLMGKSTEQLTELRLAKIRTLYFGLESGDAQTLQLINKGSTPEMMAEQCLRAQAAGLKLSVTAILGLSGRGRTLEHAQATAAWINQVSPAYFSLLTMFRRHNDAYFRMIDQLSNGEVLQEALTIVERLNPQRTILRSNHVSNILNLAGSYPKDRERIIHQAQNALLEAKRYPDWFNLVPDEEADSF